MAAEREFAVDDGAAEAALDMVVGRFDAVGVGEGRGGGPALEEVAGEVAVVLGARAPPGGVLEQGSSRSPQTVGLSASGQPAGTAVSFSPASVTAGSSSTMTVKVGAATSPGAYTITVTGTGTSIAHTTTSR
jgi:hypothetical protein